MKNFRSRRPPLYITGGPKVTDTFKKFITLLVLNIFLLFFQSIENYPSDINKSKYSTEERTLIVQWHFELHGSNSETQRCYRRHFNTRDAPSVNAIKGIISHFQRQGAVCDLPRSGRPHTARNDENREELERSLEENPSVSTRRRS